MGFYILNYRATSGNKKLFGNIPVYWQMTDMSILTGGCHYSWGCDGYTKDCSFCPALSSFPDKSISKKTLSKKMNSF